MLEKNGCFEYNKPVENRREVNTTMMYSDLPISNSGEDLLDRASFAKATARSLVNMQESGTFTVGLFGKWGTGKTSLINMILQEVTAIEGESHHESKTLVIRFEPWNFSNTDQLLSQFFVRLIKAFYSKKDKNLQKASDAIEEYLMSLVGFTKLIPVIGEQVNDIANKSFSWAKRKAAKGALETDILLQKEKVIALLEKANRRVLIVIDDIDRLSNEQIRCVFQLVTSVAKFPKTTYLLAFDNDIVVKALEDVQKGNGEAYLEKVIQIPIQIPALWQGKVEEILFRRLDTIIAENNGFNFDAQYWQRQYPLCVKPFIRTLRDINRLCNAVRFKIQGIADDLNFTDIVSITAIEIQYPGIYNWIISNKTLLTGGIDKNLILSSQWKKADWEEITTEQWKHLLNSNDQFQTDSKPLETITEAIANLFPFIGNKLELFSVRIDPLGQRELRAGNHIAHQDKFDRYFEFRLGQTSITRSELKLLLTVLDETQIIDYIKGQTDVGKIKELLEEIRAHYSELSPTRAKILINSIISSSDHINNEKADFFYLGNRTTAEYLLRSIFTRIPDKDRFPIINALIMSADKDMHEMLADMLNTTELAFGRLAAEGKTRDIIKIVTLDELLEWERVFTERTQELLEDNNLFEFSNCRLILYLLEQFDAEYTTKYMKQLLKSPQNVVRYLEHTIGKWPGDQVFYEVNDSYQRYISAQQIIEAIENCKNDKSLFSTDKKIQLLCAVFYLHYEKPNSEVGHVSYEDAQRLISKWRAEAMCEESGN